jgi:hypothetical protein
VAVNISPVSRITSHDRGGVASGDGRIVIKTGEERSPTTRRRTLQNGACEASQQPPCSSD